MIRRSRIAALAAVAALAVAGCANNDAKESDVVDAMLDAGLSQEEADCIGSGIDDAFGNDQDLYNDVAGASDPEELADLPGDAGQQVNDVLDQCLGGGSGAGDDGGETTETTAGG